MTIGFDNTDLLRISLIRGNAENFALKILKMRKCGTGGRVAFFLIGQEGNCLLWVQVFTKGVGVKMCLSCADVQMYVCVYMMWTAVC